MSSPLLFEAVPVTFEPLPFKHAKAACTNAAPCIDELSALELFRPAATSAVNDAKLRESAGAITVWSANARPMPLSA